MSLNEQLDALKAQNVAKRPKEIVNIMLDDMKKMSESQIVEKALKAGTFVVDVDGTITCADVDADYTKRAEPSDVLAILKSLTK